MFFIKGQLFFYKLYYSDYHNLPTSKPQKTQATEAKCSSKKQLLIFVPIEWSLNGVVEYCNALEQKAFRKPPVSWDVFSMLKKLSSW